MLTAPLLFNFIALKIFSENYKFMCFWLTLISVTPFPPPSQSCFFLNTTASVPLAMTSTMPHSEFTLIADALECVTSVCDVTDSVICEGQTKGVVLKPRIQDNWGGELVQVWDQRQWSHYCAVQSRVVIMRASWHSVQYVTMCPTQCCRVSCQISRQRLLSI